MFFLGGGGDDHCLALGDLPPEYRPSDWGKIKSNAMKHLNLSYLPFSLHQSFVVQHQSTSFILSFSLIHFRTWFWQHATTAISPAVPSSISGHRQSNLHLLKELPRLSDLTDVWSEQRQRVVRASRVRTTAISGVCCSVGIFNIRLLTYLHPDKAQPTGFLSISMLYIPILYLRWYIFYLRVSIGIHCSGMA